MQQYITKAGQGHAQRMVTTVFERPGGWQAVLDHFDQTLTPRGFRVISPPTCITNNKVAEDTYVEVELPNNDCVYHSVRDEMLVVVIDTDRFGPDLIGNSTLNDPAQSERFAVRVVKLGGSKALWSEEFDKAYKRAMSMEEPE